MEFPKHFKLSELVRTDTGLPNVPTWEQAGNLRLLGLYLDRVRDEFGMPVFVTSGFRSMAVNERVGGVPASAHRKGLAADIVPAYGSDDAFARLLAALERVKPETVCSADIPMALDQLIVYCRKPKDLASGIRFFHVGVNIDGKPRRQVLWK